MNNKSFLRLSVAAALAVIATPSALAAGFQINEHSANGLGRAMAGQAAMPENASILATNPAAMTEFDSVQTSAALSYINPNIDIAGEMTTYVTGAPTTVPASEDDIADAAFVPAVFYVSPIDNKLSVGVGAFSNYGLSTDYSDAFNGLLFADEAEVTTVTINPAVAYKVTDTLSLGLGVSATYAEAKINTTTPALIGAATGGAIPGNATILQLEGDDWGYGWNVGAFWKATDSTDIALSYRAETKLNLEGDVSSDLRAELNQGGSLDLNLASITEFAVNQRLDDQWSVQFSANFTEWSTFEKLEAKLDSGSDLLLKEEHFENSWRLSLGTTYALNDQLTLRAGFAYDQGAVSDLHRSLSIPDTDRQWFTLGGTYAFNDSMSVDLGYAFLDGREASVNSMDETFVTSLSAQQSATAHIFSAQFNAAF